MLFRDRLHAVLDGALRSPLDAAANTVERCSAAARQHVAQTSVLAALVEVVVPRQQEIDLVLRQDRYVAIARDRAAAVIAARERTVVREHDDRARLVRARR